MSNFFLGRLVWECKIPVSFSRSRREAMGGCELCWKRSVGEIFFDEIFVVVVVVVGGLNDWARPQQKGRLKKRWQAIGRDLPPALKCDISVPRENRELIEEICSTRCDDSLVWVDESWLCSVCFLRQEKRMARTALSWAELVDEKGEACCGQSCAVVKVDQK